MSSTNRPGTGRGRGRGFVKTKEQVLPGSKTPNPQPLEDLTPARQPPPPKRSRENEIVDSVEKLSIQDQERPASNEENSSTSCSSQPEEEGIYLEQEEYEAQFFDFHPRAFFDNFHDTLYEAFKDACAAELEPGLKSENFAPAEVKATLKNVKRAFDKNVKGQVARLERLGKNCFKIPDHVVMEEDKICLKHEEMGEVQTRATLKAERKRIKELEREIPANRYAIEALEAEKEEIGKVLQEFTTLKSLVDNLLT